MAKVNYLIDIRNELGWGVDYLLSGLRNLIPETMYL